MNYQKLTVEKFAENLSGGQYASLTGARRAIGKVQDWTKKQRESARVLADKHFSDGGTKAKPAAKKVAKKPLPKATTAATAASPTPPVKRGARKPAPKEVVDTRTQPQAQTDILPIQPYSLTAEQIASNPHHAASIADRIINSVATALTVARAIHQNNQGIDISDIEEQGAAALRKAVALLDQNIDPVYAAAPVRGDIKKVFGTKKTPPHETNGVVPPPGTPAMEPPSSPAGAEAAPVDPHEEELFNKCADAVQRAHRTPEQVLAEDTPPSS